MFRGFDSSIIFILRGGIPRPMGDFPECLSQAMLVGVMLVGRLGVHHLLWVVVVVVYRVSLPKHGLGPRITWGGVSHPLLIFLFKQ